MLNAKQISTSSIFLARWWIYHYLTQFHFLGKGFGQVKIRHEANNLRIKPILVVIFVTQLQLEKDVKKYDKFERVRNSQVEQLLEQIENSSADVVIVGG